MPRKKKKKNDSVLDIDGDDVSIDLGIMKFKGSKGPTKEERALRAKLRQAMDEYNKARGAYYSLREKTIRLEERLNFYRQMVTVLLPKLQNAKDTPDEQKKEAIEKIEKWLKDLTEDDNLEG